MAVAKDQLILNELRRAGESPLWLRELARRCQLNPGLVLYYLHHKLSDAVHLEKRNVHGQRYLVYLSLKKGVEHEDS